MVTGLCRCESTWLIRASITAAAQTAGDVEVVVNNAGVLTVRSALDADAIEALQSEVDVNVYGLMRVAQAFAPVLKANGGGALVQLNSVASVKTFADLTTYCASKAASYAVTQGLRQTLKGQGTHVVSVHPGPIKTDMGVAAGFESIGDSPMSSRPGSSTRLPRTAFTSGPTWLPDRSVEPTRASP